MDFLSYRETGHIGGPSGKGHIRALDIRGIRRYREISHVCLCIAKDSHILSTKNNSVFAYEVSIYLTS